MQNCTWMSTCIYLRNFLTLYVTSFLGFNFSCYLCNWACSWLFLSCCLASNCASKSQKPRKEKRRWDSLDMIDRELRSFSINWALATFLLFIIFKLVSIKHIILNFWVTTAFWHRGINGRIWSDLMSYMVPWYHSLKIKFASLKNSKIICGCSQVLCLRVLEFSEPK
jgi:hypothetical protein